ncbi:motile sperm domain-containing protein 2-like [Patiria miniata]|uniref:Motile sperm domain-containing protein 2 n=1 Tax=Patiria miniata TaxID=46514 RepID=A0A913ZXJ9_PATMI|nr:motile sperm domain-containing protein 2-like [Patiria miniata]
MPGPRALLDEDMVARFRAEFFEQYTDGGHNEAYDPRDVEVLRTSDKYVHKFLMIAKMDFKLTGEKINTVFKWRKQFGLNDMTFDSFDEEVLTSGGFYSHNRCKIGRRIVWFKICKYKKDPSRTNIVKQFMAFWLNKMESEAMGEDVVILMDMTNAGLSNLDMDVVKFMITCFELYFPALVGIMLVHDMHWVLNAIWKIIEKLLSAESREHIKFVRGPGILELIAPDQLPPYMGGTDEWEWTWPLPEEEKDVLLEIEDSDDHQQPPQDDSMFSIPNGDVSRMEDGTPEPSPLNSPRAKRVHFAPGTGGQQLGVADEGDGLTSEKKRMPRRTPKKQKLNIHKGALLTIKPGDQLVFEEPSQPTDNEPSLVMSLTNTTDRKVAYKIKTTTPDRYKVRPSAGPVNPGASINVTITLLSGDKDSVSRDKFLVISTELTEVLRTPGELTEFWKKVEQDDIIEHRVRCVFQASKKPEMDIAELKRDMSTLKSKVDSLTQQVATITDNTTKLLRLVLIQLVLLLCLAMYYFLFSPSGSVEQPAMSGAEDQGDYCPAVRD